MFCEEDDEEEVPPAERAKPKAPATTPLKSRPGKREPPDFWNALMGISLLRGITGSRGCPGIPEDKRRFRRGASAAPPRRAA